MTLTITERVAAGATWLDQNKPGWIERIRLNALSLNECEECVLGHVFGDYWRAPLADSNPNESMQATDEHNLRAAAMGFTIEASEYNKFLNRGGDDPWSALQAEWYRLIEERRAVSP